MPLNKITRRGLVLAGGAMLLPLRALALSENAAQRYVQSIIDDFLTTINSNSSQAAMMQRFQTVFASYADSPTIARLVIGAPWRGMSSNQRNGFIEAFTTYLTAKYGQKFMGYRGASISITRVVDAGRKGVLVHSEVRPAGGSAFALDWHVSDGSGRVKMLDMIIEGISLISSEREEMRALLSRNGNDINRLIANLRG